jgi:hypothetical protein
LSLQIAKRFRDCASNMQDVEMFARHSARSADEPVLPCRFPGTFGGTVRQNLTPVSTSPSPAKPKGEPSQPQVMAMAFLTALVFVTVIRLFGSFASVVDGFGDSSAYMSVAWAIRHWNFQGLEVNHFWGLLYLMATVSLVSRLSDRPSLLLICFLAVDTPKPLLMSHDKWKPSAEDLKLLKGGSIT